MKTLYRYRPLSEFLFKELFYHELYFASYYDLNDPLDLSARIEFSCQDSEQIEYLLFFLLKTTLFSPLKAFSDGENKNEANLLRLYNDKPKLNKLKETIFLHINQESKTKMQLWQFDIENIMLSSLRKNGLEVNFNFESFRNELNRITSKFLENSYVSCFSENNNNFLMWSHYASKHSGICLEFSLEYSGLFPYVHRANRSLDVEKYKERLSKWELETYMFWDKIKKVNYEVEQPYINFFEFSPVFDNEHDCDLIGLSKPWTHFFAHQLEMVFSTKTKPWEYENEWRAIQINFGNPLLPEERIRHYPLESLKAIYFGMRTPNEVKNRIHQIFDKQQKKLQYFECKPSNGKDLEFIEWEHYEH